MKNNFVESFLKSSSIPQFPSGICCANHCRDCAYMEMENNHYNDGTRRCSYKGEWLPPYSPACPNFRY